MRDDNKLGNENQKNKQIASHPLIDFMLPCFSLRLLADKGQWQDGSIISILLTYGWSFQILFHVLIPFKGTFLKLTYLVIPMKKDLRLTEPDLVMIS